ncbi:hypothetical protein FOL47_007291 [Perkinsus chesapeaki]|uniref:Chromo domain-containing protein n=1 Tax=Perkinsus chesapeaki TaxID=330153 RepID=A0A7J6LLH4_PERCH|nr:hypothetical protein FOL47_007291 [Perkinsus chesapeaki]
MADAEGKYDSEDDHERELEKLVVDLRKQLNDLQLENAQLKSALHHNGQPIVTRDSTSTTATSAKSYLARPLSISIRLRVHFVYASPMVLTDSLGTTVVKTLHQLGITQEYLQLEEAIKLASDIPMANRPGGGTIPWIRRIYGQCALTAGTPSGLLQLRQILYEEKARLPTPDHPRHHIPIVHLSMHAVEMVVAGKKATRCILEDDIGKAHLVEADELGKLLGLDSNTRLVFINACRSLSVGEVFTSHFGVEHVVCLGHEEAILDSAATLFTQEFYAALLFPTVTIRQAFDRARHAVKSSANPKIASQYTLFHLLPESGHHDIPVWATPVSSSNRALDDGPMKYYPPSMLVNDGEPHRKASQGYSFDRNLRPIAVRCIPAEAVDSDDDEDSGVPTPPEHYQNSERPLVPLGSSNLGIEGSPLGYSAPVEDFLGRDIDIVRLCSILHTPRNRRVVAVTGPKGCGKRTLVTQTAMYYSMPGGRFLSGGACVVLLPRLWPTNPTSSKDLVTSKTSKGIASQQLYTQGDGAGGENESLLASEVAIRFIRVVMREIKTTVHLLKEWYPPQTRSSMPEDFEEDEEELFVDDDDGSTQGGSISGRRSPMSHVGGSVSDNGSSTVSTTASSSSPTLCRHTSKTTPVAPGPLPPLAPNKRSMTTARASLELEQKDPPPSARRLHTVHSSSSLSQSLERGTSSSAVNRSISSAHYAEKESIQELEMELFGVPSSGMGTSGGLGTRGYKVFLSEQFADAAALEQFLKGYNVPPIPVNRLLKELRENGTQLQDWGTGKLVRVVHVVRCMISDANEKEEEERDIDGEHVKAPCLVERRVEDGKLKLLSKKFDPVTENVLEVCSEAVKKEIAHSVSDVSVRKVVMRNRKPLVELERSSPTYKGLATKYVLYTTEVLLDGLPSGVDQFETTEAPAPTEDFSLGGDPHSPEAAKEGPPPLRVHHWEWLDRDCAEDLFLREGHGEAAAAAEKKESPSVPQQSLEWELASGVARQVEGERVKEATSKLEACTKRLQRCRHEWARAMREWANVTDTMNSARSPSSSVLVLLRAENYMPIPEIRQLLGQALSKHKNLKIILTMEDASTPAEAALWDQALMQPIQTVSVAYKVVCFRVPPLQQLDAAMLFARRVHRPLYEADIRITTQAMVDEFDSAGGQREGNDAKILRLNDSGSEGLSNLARLAKHPVLVRLRGNPGNIIKVAALVGPQTPTLMHIMASVREILGLGVVHKSEVSDKGKLVKKGSESGTPKMKKIEELPHRAFVALNSSSTMEEVHVRDGLPWEISVSLTPEGLKNVEESRVGLCYDFIRNQWVVRYGVNIEVFPIQSHKLDPKLPRFEGAFSQATEWFLRECERHRSHAKASKGDKEEGASQGAEKRPNNTLMEQPKKKVKAAVPKERPPPRPVVPEDNKREGDGKDEDAIDDVGRPKMFDSISNVHDYRKDGTNEEYLVTGKVGGQLVRKMWILISQCASKKDEDRLRGFRDKRLAEDEDSDSESIYELERIEGYKKAGKKEEFFVKWRGYSSAENTWEPLRNLTGVSNAEIEEARQKFGKKAAAKRGAKKSGKDAQSSDTQSRYVFNVLLVRDSLKGSIIYLALFASLPGCNVHLHQIAAVRQMFPQVLEELMKQQQQRQLLMHEKIGNIIMKVSAPKRNCAAICPQILSHPAVLSFHARGPWFDPRFRQLSECALLFPAMNDSISSPKEESDSLAVPPTLPALPAPPAGFIPLEALECEEVEFIDAIEDSPREAGNGTPVVEASIVTTSTGTDKRQEKEEKGVEGELDGLPVLVLDAEAPAAINVIEGKTEEEEKEEEQQEQQHAVEEVDDELDALENRLAEGWQSPWSMPRGVNSEFLEELIQRNLERFDLPPGVYAKATSSESVGEVSPSASTGAEDRRWHSGFEEGASPSVERKEPSQPSGQGLFDKEPLIADDGSPKRDKKRKKKKLKSEKKEHRRGGKLRKVGEHHGDASGRHRNRLSAKRRRISLEEDIDSPLHAAHREPTRTMELDMDEEVPEFHVPKWTGSAFEIKASASEAPKDKPEEEVVNLVAGDADTSGVSGGSGDQPGTPKVQFDTTKPLKPELVLAASVLPPTAPSSGNRARVRTYVVTAVKAPLVSIVGSCTDMRKVEVALKRHVDRKGLWWDWSYGKKSKLETGGGYVRVDLDPLLRQVCMCTVASFKEVLYHARRYIEVDESKTIEVDCEDEQLVNMGQTAVGSDEIEAEVEEPMPLKVPARSSPSTERRGSGKATGRRKWSGKDWNKTTSAGKEPAWKSSAGSGKVGWKNNKNGKWDSWNDWKGSERKNDDWKSEKGNWKDSETAKEWTGGGGGKNNTSWDGWGEGKWDEGDWGKDWSASWDDDRWKDEKWNEKWDNDWNKTRSASKSPEWKPRADWSDSDSKCQWNWNENQWEKKEDGPTATPKPLEVTEPAEVPSPGSRTRRYGSDDEEDLRSPTSALVAEGIPKEAASEGEAMSIIDEEEKPEAGPMDADVVSNIPPEELAQVTQLCHRLFWPLEDIQWLFDVTSPSDTQPSEAQSMLRELALNTIVVCPTGGLAKYADGEGDIPGTVVLRDIPDPVPVGGLVPSKKVEQNISSLTVELVKYAAADLPELRHRVSALQYIRAACDIIEFLDGAEWDEGQIMQLLGDADEARRIPPDEV